jgi:hypothetical protein
MTISNPAPAGTRVLRWMATTRAYLLGGALTLLTVGPSSTSVYHYRIAVSRQLEFVVHRQSEPQRGAANLSLLSSLQ